MRVTHLSLGNFRNYETAEVSFAPGVNLVIGPNGQGKTNLVEAISYFSQLASHRVSSDVALIRAGCGSAVMRMRLSARDREVVLEMHLHRDRANQVFINRNPARARELPRWFSSVMFAPEDLAIVRGEPAVRRRFLDDAVVSVNPAMRGVLLDYERIVRQRSALLRTARAGGSPQMVDQTMHLWDDQLVKVGTRIMWERRQLLARLEEPLTEAYRALVESDHAPTLRMRETMTVSRETFTVSELAQVSRETLLAEAQAVVQSVVGRERDRGITLVGPQRDDLELQLHGLPVRGFASHGESWSFALALRLALAQVLRQDSIAGDPVLILDDVFAELDQGRRQRLMAAVGEYEQVIVTSAVAEDLPTELTAHRIGVLDGVASQLDEEL